MKNVATSRASNQLTRVASIAETARRLGCSVSAIESIRSGRMKPSAQLREKIRAEFGIDPESWNRPEARHYGQRGPHRPPLPEGVTIDRSPDGQGFVITLPTPNGIVRYTSRVGSRDAAEESARRTARGNHGTEPCAADRVLFVRQGQGHRPAYTGSDSFGFSNPGRYS